MSRERLSPQQWARLEQELRKGPLAHGFAADQRWTLGRIKTLIGKLFRVGYTVEGTQRRNACGRDWAVTKIRQDPQALRPGTEPGQKVVCEECQES